jgi:hypothetical protein
LQQIVALFLCLLVIASKEFPPHAVVRLVVLSPRDRSSR